MLILGLLPSTTKKNRKEERVLRRKAKERKKIGKKFIFFYKLLNYVTLLNSCLDLRID